jgi:Flp pilus assembly protein TadG
MLTSPPIVESSAGRWHERAENRGVDEKGMSSVELLISMAALLTLMFMIVHIGLMFHARNIANEMASAALRTAQRHNGTADEAEARAVAIGNVEGLEGRIVRVEVNRTETRVSVLVEVRSERVIPRLSNQVIREISGPVERFIPESDRQ